MNSSTPNHQTKCFFSHWAHKSYAVFNSLNKVVHMGVLKLCYFLVFIPVLTQGQSDTLSISQHELDEVLVEEDLPSSLSSTLIRTVTVMTAQDIAQQPTSSLSELLEGVLDLDIRSRGSKQTQADISIRGGNFDQVMILLNGVNITDPQTGHHNLLVPLSLDNIERIEVLSGAGAFKWGDNAFSGAINIITKFPDKWHKHLQLAAGSHQYLNLDASLNFPIATSKNLISVSSARSDGYTDNTDFKDLSLIYTGRLIQKTGNATWQLTHNRRAFGANAFYTPAYPEQFQQTDVSLASISWNDKRKLNLSPTIYYRRNKSHFELFRHDSPDWYASHNYHINQVWGASLGSKIYSHLGVTQMGTRFRKESIISNVLGYPSHDSIPVSGIKDVYYDHDYSRNKLVFYIEHSYAIGSLYGNVSGMAHYSDRLKDKTSFLGELMLSYSFSSQLHLGLACNQSMRLPTFTDLFYSGPNNVGNPHLNPERAINYETKLSYTHPQLTAQTTFFYRMGSDIIDWIKTSPDEPWHSVNHTSINTFGISSSIQSSIPNCKYIDKLTLQYAFLDEQNRNKQEISSKYVLDYLRHKIDLSIRHHILPKLSANWNLSYQDRAGKYLEYKGNDYTTWLAYDPFFLLDMRMEWKQSEILTIFGDLTNITHTQYQDISNIPQAGFEASIGVKMKW